MKIFNLDFKLNSMPEVFLRGEHVMAVVKDKHDKFVLGKKNIYPEGISRFVGGGLEEANPTTGIVREIQEELSVNISEDRIIHLAKINCQIEHNQSIIYTAHLFFVKISEGITASSDLDGLEYLDENGLNKLIKNFRSLTDATEPIFDYSWADYGRVFAQIHQIGLDRVRELGL